MILSDIQASITRKLNRRDMTATDLNNAVNLGIQRAQRLLRVPASEATVDYTWQSTDVKFAIPGNYLKMVSLSVDGGDPLDRRSLKEVRRYAQATGNAGTTPTPLTGVSKMYARDGSYFIIAPQPTAGQVIEIVYAANFTALINSTDSSWLSDIASDIVVYGALSELGDTFVDPRQPVWEKKFVTAIEDLNNQASEDELTNAQVEPVYHLNDSSYFPEW